MENKPLEPNKGGSVSKRSMRRQIQKHFPEIMEVLLTDLRSHNPSVSIAAAKVLINKILPDLKATEVTPGKGAGIRVIFEDYAGHPNNPPTETEGSTRNQ